MKLVWFGDGGFITFAFLCQNVQENWLILTLEELESFRQQRNVVSINRTVITQPKFFKDDAGQKEILYSFFEFVRKLNSGPPAYRFDKASCFVMQTSVGRIRNDVIQIIRDRSDIFGNRPFVIVQNHDKTTCL